MSKPNQSWLPGRNLTFWSALCGVGSMYLSLIVAMLIADFQFTSWEAIRNLLSDQRVRYSIGLSLITSTIAAIVAMWFAVPMGYLLARWRPRPKLGTMVRGIVIAILDIPIALPPIVVGISLLVLFQTSFGRNVDSWVGVALATIGFEQIRGITYEIPAIILAQFTVAAAFAIRTMRGTYEQIDQRPEQIAKTLGASDYLAFAKVAFPQSITGMVSAFTLAWARSIGEFGPILIFAGTTRMKTEVLSTTVYLSFQSGDLSAAVAASVILVTLAVTVIVLTRLFTLGNVSSRNAGSSPA
jgi:molybdate transport system permease protein